MKIKIYFLFDNLAPDKQESFLITSATSNVTTSKLSGGRRRISVRRQCNFADNLKDNTLIGNKASNNEQTRSQVFFFIEVDLFSDDFILNSFNYVHLINLIHI